MRSIQKKDIEKHLERLAESEAFKGRKDLERKDGIKAFFERSGTPQPSYGILFISSPPFSCRSRSPRRSGLARSSSATATRSSAGTPENLFTISGGSEPEALEKSAADRELVRTGLRREYLLIFGYTSLMIALGLRTWQPGDTHSRRLRCLLVILPVIVGVSDVLENSGASRALGDLANVSPSLVQFTLAATWAKWIAGFLQMLVLGHSLLGVPPLAGAGAFLRELARLILLAAGFTGMFGIRFPSIIPNTFLFGLFALVPLGLMLFFCDDLWKCPCGLRQLRS